MSSSKLASQIAGTVAIAGATYVAANLLTPALQHGPVALGRWLANKKWKVHFYAVSTSNPAESFCCVSIDEIAADPLLLLEGDSLTALLPLTIVPVRFSKDPVSGLSIRPSSTSNGTPLAQHWLGHLANINKKKMVSEAGVNLFSFERASDSMVFTVAKTVSAAQVAMSDLSQRNALWAELNHRGPALPGFLAEVIA
jgi:hypothetical protein